ncbi:tRNA wybutosine-synthesizing protein 4 isoform 6-T10 [Chlamydotis macqueenii]
MGRERPGAPRPAAVQGTGGSSAVSKCSAAARGYIHDRFLRLLVGRQRRRAPLVHRGYYIRARAIDHCVQDFLLKTQSHPRTQILSLGAGFDSLYFRLKDMGLLDHTVVYEVDFPNVACQKAALIKGTKELSALVGDIGEEGVGVITFSGEDYKLLGVDLSELFELERALEEAGLDSEIPTLFIAEVVLTYMENCRSDALIQWAAEHFSQACFLLYEQMHPEDPFGRVMQQHFSQLNSALHSLAQYPDCEAQQRRFFEKGWTECSVMDMNEFFTCCTPEEEQQRVQALEPFDEYEEWHLKCSHYFVLTASKGMEPSWTPLLSNMTGKKYLFLYGGRSAVEPVLGDWYFLHTQELSCTMIPVEGPVPESRHSHSACSWKGGALIAGGLGAAEQPLGSVFFLRKLEHGFQWQAVETRPPLIPRYSHTAHVHDGKLLLVGGVWFHSSSVPGITVIDLMTGLCLDYTINVEYLEWPLMLHNHSSVFLPNEKELLLIGGGGNCFSFGTHLNPDPVSLSLSNILTSH